MKIIIRDLWNTKIGKIYKDKIYKENRGGRSPQLLSLSSKINVSFVKFIKNSNMHVKSVFLLITIVTFVALKPVKSVSPFVFIRLSRNREKFQFCFDACKNIYHSVILLTPFIFLSTPSRKIKKRKEQGKIQFFD